MKLLNAIKKFIDITLSIFIFILFISRISAQTFNFTIYNSSNSGISPGNITTLAIDKMGIKWMGIWNTTQNRYGISTFNGINWVNYDSINNYALNAEITSITVDDNNNKWIGTFGNGLIKFDGTTWTNYDSTNSGLFSNHISAVFADSYGNIWVSSRGNLSYNFKISKFDGSNWSYYNCNFFINKIAQNPNDKSIWFVSPFEVLRYEGGNWTTYNSNNAIYGLRGFSIGFELNNNNIWIASCGHGIYKFNGINWINYYDSTYNNYITHLYENASCVFVDEFNYKWYPSLAFFSTPNGAIYINNDSTWITDSLINACFIYNTSSLYDIIPTKIDSVGNKWIGTVNDLVKLDCFLPKTPAAILGTQWVYNGQNSVTYKVPKLDFDFTNSYVWVLPNGFTGSSTSDSITVNVGNNAVSGNIIVYGKNKCGNGNPTTINVTITPMGVDEEYISLINTKVYPNPAKDKLTIESNINKLINYDIINIMGQTVYSSYLNSGKTNINISEFAKGIYTIKLYSEKGNVVKKFVKE